MASRPFCRRRSVEALQSEKDELDAKLAAMNVKEKEISSKIGHSVDRGSHAGQDVSSRHGVGAPVQNERTASETGATEGGVLAAASSVLDGVKSAVGLGGGTHAPTGESRSMV